MVIFSPVAEAKVKLWLPSTGRYSLLPTIRRKFLAFCRRQFSKSRLSEEYARMTFLPFCRTELRIVIPSPSASSTVPT